MRRARDEVKEKVRGYKKKRKEHISAGKEYVP